MDKVKKFAGVTENLNKLLSKKLEDFGQNLDWSGINYWLEGVQSILKNNTSPFITEKILLSKRLNQCLNPILPNKVHQVVIRIHEIIFMNMRLSVDGNINQYVRLFAEDLGVYSISILPYFTHASETQQRIMVLELIDNYYLDLGKELIPMVTGFIKSILPVYCQTNDNKLDTLIQNTLQGIMEAAGRKYMIGAIWSSILKFQDCRVAGLSFLNKTIEKMEFIKGQQNFSESHGFSEEENQLREEQMRDLDLRVTVTRRKSEQNIVEQKMNEQNIHEQKSPNIKEFDTPVRILEPSEVKQQTSSPPKVNLSPKKIQRFHTIKQQQQKSQNSQDKLSLGDNKNPQQEMQNQPSEELKIPMSFKKRQNSARRSSRTKSVAKSKLPPLDKVPLMISPGVQLISEGIDNKTNSNNYPNTNTLVVSAIVSCLEDENPFTKRAALDFMFTHLRLKNPVFSDDDRKILVEGAIRLFRKKQISICKRINRWIFGKQNEQNKFDINENNKYVIVLIIDSLKQILSTQPTSEQNCTVPLKILQNFYIQHPNMVSETLSKISVHLLRYIFNYQVGYQFSGQIQKVGQRFLENLPSYYPIILQSFGNIFLQGIKTNDNHKCFQIIKYIDHTFIRLMKHEHGIQQLTYLTSLLEYLSIGMKAMADKQQFYCTYMKDSSLLILNLVRRRQGIIKSIFNAQEKVNRQFAKDQSMVIPIERQKYQQSLINEISKKQVQYIGILENIEVFFIRLGEVMKYTPNITIYEDTFRNISQAIIFLQKCLPKDMVVDELPKWFQTIESGIRVSNPAISLSAIDAMIKCLMFQDDKGKQNHQSSQFYSSFKKLIVFEKTKKVGSDYQKLALEKLWSLLDYPHMHSRIIDLIVNFSKYFPYEFTDTVKKSFMTHNVPQKEASIQRFSHFWRLTGFKYKDLLVNNQQFVELNKVGLFVMLDFLDDQNPLVRHAAKNWLMESMGLFYRVLEPLFNQLMKACRDWYVTPKGICLIKNVYETKIVFDTFRRIRSILSNGSYAFLRYIYQSPISDMLDQIRQTLTDINFIPVTEEIKEEKKAPISTFQREPVLPQVLQNQLMKVNVNANKKITYMDLLIILCVKYIEGQSIESMGIQFYIGNSGVNTSSIELIQSLLNYIDSPILSHRLINYILDPLFKVLNQVVTNKEYIIQIQLLNLFKAIISSSNAFRKKGQLHQVRQFFKMVFSNPYFVPSLLKGLKTPFSYVRTQFITFITICIPLIADFLQPEDCTRCIKQILVTYYKIIKQIRITLVGEVLAQEENRNEKIVQQSLSRITEMELKARQQQKMTRLTNNLQQVAKTNQILSVLHGVSSILNYFYDLNEFQIKSLKFEFTNPYTILDTFRTIITLGLSSAEKDGKLVSKTNFLHNLDTCSSILKDLSPVYQTILRAWPLSQQYVRIATEQFSSIGMKNFSFQRFSRYNKVVQELISYVVEQKQSIWGKIFAIMQPMFYKFPSQITQIYLKLWVRQCPDADDEGGIRADPQKTQFLMKIVQTIIVNNFPINVMINAILQTSTVKVLKDFYQKKANQTEKGIVLDYGISCTQAKVLYFIYVYFNYVHLNEKNFTKDKLLQVWTSVLKSIKPFLKSKTPTTALWILQIIHLCSKKYSPKQLLSIQKFKSDLHEVIKEKIKYLANVGAKKITFFYEQPTKIGFDDIHSPKFKFIVPLSPCLYQIFRSKPKDLNQTDQMIFKSLKPGDVPQIGKRNRLIVFKALKKIALQLLQNTYLPQKNQWVIVRTCEWMEIILPVIEDKTTQNMVFAESASEVLYDLLEKARVLFIKSLRPSIVRIFNKDDFFICNVNTLNYWAKIIDWMVSIDKNNQTFIQYLDKVSLQNSYFTKINVQQKRRIMSFQRICFILYSGCRDRYALKIKGLLQKIAQVIRKAQGTHPALLILILFAIRILILRLSQLSLSQLFIDIWPMLLSLLMQLFTKNMVKVELANEISRNPNLLLAGLKLIEMISIFNLSEFAHHQWIFIFDYFGIKIMMNETLELQNFFSKKPEFIGEIITSRIEKEPPFIYRPYLSSYFPHYSLDYNPQRSDISIKFPPIKRKIVITDSSVNDETQVKVRALALAQYMASIRQYRTEISLNEAEKIIVNDFINLDSFIHKIA